MSGRELSDALRSSAAASCVLRAKAAYSAEDLKGSDHKDVLGSLSFRAAGAHVDSSIESVRDGLVLIGAPPEKRLALAWISLKAACLPQISEELASALAGSWISALMYRRCFMATFGTFFSLCRAEPSSDPGSFLRPLLRKQAQELVLLACFAPIITCNVAVDFSPTIYCSDASCPRGAFCIAEVGESVTASLWTSADKKGHYTLLERLDLALSSQTQRPDSLSPGFLPGEAHAPCTDPEGISDEQQGLSHSPSKPLGLDYDFIEVFGGCGAVSIAAAGLGMRVGPVLDLSSSGSSTWAPSMSVSG